MDGALDNLPQGWFHHGHQVLKLLKHHRPLWCVELGTWRGASAIAIARTIQHWGATLTCVDIWNGEVQIVEAAENIYGKALCLNVELMHGSTQWAAQEIQKLGKRIDCLYIDADHSYESVLADLEAWWPLLQPGGLIVGDDYGFPGLPGVKQAWDVFEQAHGLQFERTRSNDPAHAPSMRLIHGVK